MSKLITSLNWRYRDRGDCAIFPPSSSVNNVDSVFLTNRSLSGLVKAASDDGDFVLTVGGDHSIAIGSIAGLMSSKRTGVKPDGCSDLKVLWVDAHADINSMQSSPSGNMHGMPVAFLMKLEKLTRPSQEWMKDVPRLDPKNIVYIGLRDLDVGEKATLIDLGIRAYTMHDIDRSGIGNVTAEVFKYLYPRDSASVRAPPLHLSFDIDGCDPSIAASTGTAVSGGLSYRESHYLVEAAVLSGHLASMDLVEINTAIGSPGEADMTVKVGLELVASALGKMIMPHGLLKKDIE
jgi:arginase